MNKYSTNFNSIQNIILNYQKSLKTRKDNINTLISIYKISKRGWFKIINEEKELLELKNDFYLFTKNLDQFFKKNLSVRIFYYINNIDDILLCPECHKTPIIRQFNPFEILEKALNVKCSYVCTQNSQITQQRIANSKERNGTTNRIVIENLKEKNREKYGCDYYIQSDDFKKKSLNTMLNNGYDNPMHCPKIVKEMGDRYEQKHGKGIRYSFQDPDVQKQINDKNLQNLRVKWPMQSKDIHQIMNINAGKTQKENFYNNVILNDDFVKPLFSLNEYLDNENKKLLFKWKCKKCNMIFESNILYGKDREDYGFVARCPKCYPILCNTSYFELDVANWCKTIPNVNVMSRSKENKQIIPPQEIDIIIDKGQQKRLLIETDGLYWHSSCQGKDQFYHLNKTINCEKQGFQLIHIFEDEWKNKQEIVKSIIMNQLSCYNYIYSGLNCQFIELNEKETADFIFNNSLNQNYGKYNYSLSYGKDIKILMSFDIYEKIISIVNFSYKKYSFVSRGAELLLNKIISSFNPQQIIWSIDRRYEIGKLQEKLNFIFYEFEQPNYWELCKKDKHQIRHQIGELQKDQINGIIYDCGKIKFKYDID